MKKTLHFSTAAPFFWDLANLTIAWFLRYESHFLIFGLFDIFHQKCIEIQPRMEAQKTNEKACRQGPKMIPKYVKIRCFFHQKRYIAPKLLVFELLIFCLCFGMVFSAIFVDFGSQNSLPGKNNFPTFGYLFRFFSAFFCLLPFSVDLGSFGPQNRPKMSKKGYKDECTSVQKRKPGQASPPASPPVAHHQPHHQRLTNKA